MPLLSISLFGPFRVISDGEAVTSFESDKVRALLVYLAVEAKAPQRRERLAGLLWPDLPERTARTNLRHVLASLRKAIGDREASPPFLDVSRQTIQLNYSANVWVDVATFTDLLQTNQPANQQNAEQLEEAVNLYRGGFLEGFSLPGCPAFEEWALFEGERLQRLALDALRRLRDQYERQGMVERALEYAWQRVELDPWREEAHRQVMRLLAIDGQRGAALAQYETCRRILLEELGVEPGAETTRIYEQIRDGRLYRSTAEPTAVLEPEPVGRRPSFLAEIAEGTLPAPFVAREWELDRLKGFLEASLAGQGRVAFVTGGPGRGKTALLREFARQAMKAQTDLLVARGNCNAYSGVGDPYLPFRDVMAMLTGDVEAQWTAGAISHRHALRLLDALPLAVQALLDHGPHVVPALVPGAALLSRATAAAPAGAPWLRRLRERLQQLPGSEALEQGHLFQQVTNFLRVLAETHPLLLILDDLQWADSASIGLLFHLGRRLEGARILLAAAYRPEEVSQNNDVARSPDPAPATTQDDQALARVLTEFKRRFGDVWLDLAEVREPEGRRFVNALLDLEPNRLQDDFRNRLYEHAGAHPLFTVELLRSMQEHGDLVQDGTGLWVPGPALDWERLPPRVEGVIEARVGRLEREMRELLSVASVEGEVFTAQVVARVQEIDERQALQRLSQQLEKRHRLVREQSAIAVCGRRQARYRFAHALFQRYLYNDLSNGERVLLHGQIAGILEDLCADCPEELAVRAPQLAHHYSESGDKERTFKYLTLAGDVAMAAYAHEEAIGYYSRALGLLPANTAQERYHLLLAREKLYNLQGAREAQARDLAALEVLADVLDDACPLADRGRRAEVALRQANYERMTGDNAAAIAAVQAAVHLAQSARDLDHEMEGRSMWGEVLDSQGEYDAAQQQLEQALTLARESGARRVEADCLRYLGWVFWHQGIRYPTVQRTSWEQALDLYREVADRQGEANALYDLGVLYLGLGDLVGARSNFEQSHRILHEIGDRHGEATPLGNLGWVFRGEDDYAGARDPVERAMAINREVGSRQGEGADLMDLGETLAGQGYYTQSEACCNHALHIFREIRDPAREGRVLGWLGLIRYQQGEYARARAFLEDSVRICHDFGPRWVESRSLAVLSLVLHAQGDHELARSHAQQALHNGPERYHLGQGDSALALGHALAGLGDATGATAAYLQALDKYHSSGYRNPPMEALAGLARLELTGAEPWQALPLVEEILEHLRTNTLHGTYEPLRIYLTCYQALKAHDDTRTAKVLHTAHRLLREWAANIEDRGLRRSFLEEVPAHRTLVQEYEGDASGG